MPVRRVLPMLLALAALSVAVAACGNDEDPGDSVASVAAPDDTAANSGASTAEDARTSTERTGQKREDAMLEFAQCMRQHGVDVADPKPGKPMRIDGRGVDRTTMEAANKDCGKLMQDVVADASPADKQRMREHMLTFAKCMRAHGIDLPDPTEDGIQINRNSGIDPEDPAFQKAQKACEPILRDDGRQWAEDDQ